VQSRGDKAPSRVGNPPETASGTPPLHLQSSNDHNFYLQSALQTERSIGKVEGAIAALTASSDRHEAKLDKLNEDVHTAKGMVKAFGWVLSALGAIGIVILGTILTVLMKHYKLL